MSASPNDKGESNTKPTGSPVVLLLGIAWDTTWRMFAPILLFGGVGAWADVSFKTKPLLTITGIIIAVVCSGLLIKNQLNKGKTS